MYLRKITIIITAIVMAAACVLCGCAPGVQTQEESDADLPVLTVGVDVYPPFNYADENGNPTGIDIELAREAFKRMGYKAVFESIDWEKKKSLVENGDIDCIWSCFSMDGREDEYKWAGPYMISRQVVAVNEDSDIHKLSDLGGKIVAVQSTTKPEQLFLGADGIRIPRLRELYSVEDRELIYTMLGKGYVDAVAAHETSIRQYMKDYDVSYRILDESLLTTGIGVAFAINDDRGLDSELSAVFRQMAEDGTTREILSRYVDNASDYLEVGDYE